MLLLFADNPCFDEWSVHAESDDTPSSQGI